MNGRILSNKEKREVLKNELQKMRVRASNASNYINESSGKLEELQQKRNELDCKILNEDLKVSYRADYASYVGSFSVAALSISNLLTLIFQMNFLNALYINSIFYCFGTNIGFIALIDADLKKKSIKCLDKLSIKIANYLKSRSSYKSLISGRDKVQNDILILESNRAKAMTNLLALEKGIETLDFRLYCSEDRPYKVGKWATIVRKEQPLSRKKDKKTRKRVKPK